MLGLTKASLLFLGMFLSKEAITVLEKIGTFHCRQWENEKEVADEIGCDVFNVQTHHQNKGGLVMCLDVGGKTKLGGINPCTGNASFSYSLKLTDY